MLFVSLVSISFHCWSAWAHVAGQRSIVFWQWNETRQVEFHFQARFTFVVVESTQKFIFHSLVFLTLSIFWKVWIVIIDHLPWHFQLCNLLVTSCIFRFFFLWSVFSYAVDVIKTKKVKDFSLQRANLVCFQIKLILFSKMTQRAFKHVFAYKL